MDWFVISSVSLESLINATMIAYALAAIGLNVHFGYTGLLNFGQSAFLGVAAYGLAMSVATFGLPFWLGIVVGLAGVVVLALLLGIPTLRLRADYLAIVTIAAAEIVRLLYRSVTLSEWTGGSDGLQAFSDEFYALNPFSAGLDAGLITFSSRELWIITVGWILVAVSLAVVFLAMRSPWGRVIKAIREDEDAVRSLGKNVVSYKLQALMLGGILGSLGGFVYALAAAAVQPDTYGTEFTFYMYTIVILGGAARVFGPVIGSMIFWFLLAIIGTVLPALIRLGAIPTWLISNESEVGPIRWMVVGGGLVLLLIFRPQGIFGDRREVMLDAR